MDHSFNLLGIAIPIGVLFTSLIGSLHCASMCGGLIFAATDPNKRISNFIYNLSRLLGYLLLGSIAGIFGQSILGEKSNIFVAYFSTALIFTVLFFNGIYILKGKSLHLNFSFKWLQTIQIRALKLQNNNLKAATVGFFSAFLPCGWLYSFVLAAVATQNVISGAFVMIFFWMGTIPAMMFGPEFFRSVLRPFLKKSPKASGILFISLALAILGIRVFQINSNEQCHIEVIEKK